MKSNKKSRGDLDSAVLVIIFWFVTMFLMTYFGWSAGRNGVYREAVALNYAKWVPDANGNTEFVWNKLVK